MASDAKIGIGTLLKRAGVTIGEVKSISGMGGTRDVVDVTHMESVDAFREFIPGLGDAGEASFTINYIPTEATHAQLLSDFNNRTVAAWTVELPFPGTPTLSFDGFVTGYPLNIPLDDVITADVTIKISGKLTLTV